MIRFTIDSKTKTISFEEGGDIEEMRCVLEMFSTYTITPYLKFDNLNTT